MSKSQHENHDKYCDHKVAYCRSCDTAYCEYNGCYKQWAGDPCKLSHFLRDTTTYPNIGDPLQFPTTTWGTHKESVDNGTLYASACDHNS